MPQAMPSSVPQTRTQRAPRRTATSAASPTREASPAPQSQPQTRTQTQVTAQETRDLSAVFGVPEPSKSQIRDRAYLLYLARNGAPGDAVNDWCQAERELREESRRSGNAFAQF